MPKAKKLPSGNWRVQVYQKLPDGSAARKSFTAPTKKEAEFLAAQYMLNFKDKRTDDITVAEAIDRYIESKNNTLSPSTIRGYRIMQKNAYNLIKNVSVRNITELMLQNWANTNAAHYSPKAIRNQFGLLTAVLKQCKADIDYTAVLLKPKEKTEYRVPDTDDMGKIIKAVYGKQAELPVLLALMLGLRQSEICALRWSDYDGANIHVHAAHIPDEDNHIVRKETAKSYAGNRIIPNIPEYLRNRLDSAERTGEYVSPYRVPTSALRAFRKILSEAGLPPYKMHELRHANASLMLLNGTSDKYAMERLGQSTPSMIKNVYQHTFQQQQKIAADKLNSAFGDILKIS